MGLLAQLFRHRNDLPAAGSSPGIAATVTENGPAAELRPERETGTTHSSLHPARGLGEIAAAIGVKQDRRLPMEFEILLGDLLQRSAAKFVWPGKHDPSRVLRVPAGEITGGLAKGRAEISLARLVSLAPDVFRWERGEAEDPRVLLPLQKLLQQIKDEPPMVENVALAATQGTRAPNIGIRTMGGLGRDFGLPSGSPSSAGASREGAGDQDTAAGAARSPETDRRSVLPAGPPTTELGNGVAAVIPKTPQKSVLETTKKQEERQSSQQVVESVQLRPKSAAPISSTLHAVVLGGSATGRDSEGKAGTNLTLAPHAPSAAGNMPSIILAPAGHKEESRPEYMAPRPSEHPPRAAEIRAEAPSLDAGASGLPTADVEGRGSANFAALQRLFMTDGPLGLVGVAAKSAALPGLQAVWMTTPTGVAQAGRFSPGMDAGILEGIVEDFRARLKAAAQPSSGGRTETAMLRRGETTVGVFVRDAVAVAVVLDAHAFVAGVRERLARVTDCLAGAGFVE